MMMGYCYTCKRRIGKLPTHCMGCGAWYHLPKDQACAASPWRSDVENAPRCEWVAVWYAEHRTDWFKARLGVEGWETPLYKPTKTPDAFAVMGPPESRP